MKTAVGAAEPPEEPSSSWSWPARWGTVVLLPFAPHNGTTTSVAMVSSQLSSPSSSSISCSWVELQVPRW